MGICRYDVNCPGCEALVRLRLGVGLDKEQPFYYVCKKCNAATRGKLLLGDDPGTTRLELEAGAVQEPVELPNQVVTLHPDLPSRPDAAEMWDRGGSPFFMQRVLLGDRFNEFYDRLGTFRHAIDQNWSSMRRWFGYYIDQNWERFDDEGARLWSDVWQSPPSELQRHDSLHLGLDLLFAPLWTIPAYPDMKQEWVESVTRGHRRWKALNNFAQQKLANGEVLSLQRDVFHCLELFVEQRSAILPALAVELYASGHDAAIRELRLFRDDFPGLRDLYITAFETCCHVLPIVVGVMNTIDRGHHDSFDQSAKKTPTSLNEFQRLPNAQKIGLIGILPKWSHYWPIVLDRSLRNAIGHNSVRHDLPTGTVCVKDGPSIPYLDFACKVLRLVHPILTAATVLKYIRLIPILK